MTVSDAGKEAHEIRFGVGASWLHMSGFPSRQPSSHARLTEDCGSSLLKLRSDLNRLEDVDAETSLVPPCDAATTWVP